MRRTLRVFEYETVRFPCVRQDTPFDTNDWEALVRFNEAHGGRYFAVLHRGVRFAQYVGVVQIGALTVEILPKADRTPPDQASAVSHQPSVARHSTHPVPEGGTAG